MNRTNLEFKGNFTEAMKNFCEEKVSKLKKVSEFKNARFSLIVLPNKKFNLEVSLDNSIRMNTAGDDFYALVVDNVEKLFLKLTKHKKYLDKRHEHTDNFTFDEIDVEKVVREKTLMLEDMSREEAIINMELLGHDFFIYKDIDTGYVSVLYRRKDDTYGVIICR